MNSKKEKQNLNNYSLNHQLMSDEIRQIQAQQDELNRKLNEKISDDDQISKSGGRYI